MTSDTEQTTSLTEEQWRERYCPEVYPGSTAIVPRDWPEDGELLARAIAERRCWTLRLDSSHRPIIVNGHESKDRHHSIITKHPYGEEESIEVPDDGWQE